MSHVTSCELLSKELTELTPASIQSSYKERGVIQEAEKLPKSNPSSDSTSDQLLRRTWDMERENKISLFMITYHHGCCED